MRVREAAWQALFRSFSKQDVILIALEKASICDVLSMTNLLQTSNEDEKFEGSIVWICEILLFYILILVAK